jgi:hypothetical protein
LRFSRENFRFCLSVFPALCFDSQKAALLHDHECITSLYQLFTHENRIKKNRESGYRLDISAARLSRRDPGGFPPHPRGWLSIVVYRVPGKNVPPIAACRLVHAIARA